MKDQSPILEEETKKDKWDRGRTLFLESLLKPTQNQDAMKDQNTILDNESPDQKWNSGLDLYIESVHKPDHQLRSCAHNQKCFNELMPVRAEVLVYLKTLRR